MATITKESIAPLHEKVSLTLETADYLPSFESALKDYSKRANLPGFRPGKVPMGMVKKMYGASVFADEVLRTVDKELFNWLGKEKVDIFAQPVPVTNDVPEMDYKAPSAYTFDFEIGLKPAFELADLATAPIKAYNVEVTEEMVNEEVDRLQNRYGNMVDKDVVEGDEDVLNVKFVEVDEAGNKIEGGIEKDNSLLVKYFAESVRKEFIGKKAEDSVVVKLGNAFEEKELDFIAKDLGLDPADEATKDKSFKVEITKVGKLEKRELNEEFFTQMYPTGDVKTEADFRTKIYDEIYQYWANQSRSQIQDQIFHSLVDNTKIDFPEAFLKKWLVLQNSREQDGQQPKSEAQIEEEMPTFLNQLKWTLINEKITKEQDIQVQPDEIREFAKQQLFNYMGGNAPMVEEQPWVLDYVNRMMKDRKFVEDSFTRLQSEKVFEWAEKQIKPVSTPVSAEDFTKMVDEHHHHHHAH
ncbi:MAG: trigger factor [Niabella sp.]